MPLRRHECPVCGREAWRFVTTQRIARGLAERREDACADTSGDTIRGVLYDHVFP